MAIAAYARAQTLQVPLAICTNNTYLWTFNSLGQSPCLMTSKLGSVCSGTFNVPPLAPNGFYQSPVPLSDDKCLCNSVVYSLISACALCQSGTFLPWSTFQLNCTSVYTILPFDIPSDTKVPHWAYLNVTSSDEFQPAAANAVTNAPESTHISTSATSTSTSSTTSAGSSSSSSNVGPIVGGVLGAFVGLGLIAGLLFWWMRGRNRRQTPPGPSPKPMTEHLIDGSTSMTSNTTAPVLHTSPMKLYNPSDPSTFPSFPADYELGHPVGVPDPSLSFSNPTQSSGAPHATNQGLHYTGTPEV
ncbi:hypothetical protein L208DRAFT_1388882 [Tricholoma matsutake]|nr:hypothetical protein L208DRAFT_1388882 [Tricholoma matsutake 945]